VSIFLDAGELAILHGGWTGSGGFQTLGPHFAAKVLLTGKLHLFDEELGAIIRHMSYVQSGFRDRVRKIFRRSLNELMHRK
jgi:hypothetical protein